MRIVRIHIENFRGISLADIYLNGTSVFLGDNNTGKSTVFEAIELAIGADRLSRMQAIDEHDFLAASASRVGCEAGVQRLRTRKWWLPQGHRA